MKAKNTFSILIAEDDEEDRMLLTDAFNELKVEKRIAFVENGEELLFYLNNQEKYTSKEDFPQPNLMIIDLNMPKKDGRQALKEIKNNPLLKKIPAIILSTSHERNDIQASYDLGVNSFITKPVSYSGLLSIVDTLNQYWFDVVELPEI